MENKIATPSATKKILREHNLSLKKSLGQNFLVDSNIIDIITSASAIDGDEFIIEIGPGIGSLTQAVLEKLTSGKLLAVEKDAAMVEVLKDIFAEEEKLTLLNQDALKINWKEIAAEYNSENRKIKLIANLPYYVTTPIIMGVLESEIELEQLVFMVQKEVGERICAGPETKKFGSLSVAVQYHMQPEIVHQVPSSVFIPQPDVDSVIVSLSPYAENIYQEEIVNKEFFFQIVKSIFQQRRKTLRNSLSKSAVINLDRDLVTKALEDEGIGLKKRGEKLSISEMISISNRIYKMTK
ncbi:16S rRNA (adenine(1518)-N(6)/adenine(1519)-N(6))-dimethyltransferase RsmA [Halanaerobium congolense]|uniref:Ribosomal RNA small subunit methyltransferase A n=1 Tax=Halanaerobium congolense TaxID=54121 RepID=A0A1G6LL48_9FIRM|nr:16S rRNA (adenine(1518)-N(6)/adenine(1519)-N(6))-dimethyltransferase RsmA [Halanaerobium congolense]OEG62582.1 MAG: 16S rRNA (adenine(1518)-N(6)/adenine(1519)-N(6))-dimethyltransferase [Halanaerobium sp. MDAL1]PXV68705.1 dimethyladenosine transferase [Halanaerobium congolense]TDS29140.1 dimethyladenosine transferase [Halanaerobium congolense]SDC43757.1 dimethyladenosine transferase [Halanaerobium congolense]SDH44954.1 dimethyladenosine transferase [Halanaerobium congolense]